MASSESSAALKIVFGALTIGKEGVARVRTHDLKDCADILDIFQKHGHNEIDTARGYGAGSSEEYLGLLKWQDRGLVMDTKLSPRPQKGARKSYTHKAEDLKRGLLESLQALQAGEEGGVGEGGIDMWYLHAPDRDTPYVETLRAVDELRRAGYFRRFGLSNYAAWEVAQICELCDANGWARPDAYQGVYNALHRAVEPELLPCLRRYGLAFYVYNPLAGGLLTDKYRRDKPAQEEGIRFDPASLHGKLYRERYWNDAYFDALDVVRPVAERLGLTTAEAALRWVSHHGLLKSELGDAIVIGASSKEQLEENLANVEKGPLPEEMVRAFDQGWAIVKGVCHPYFR